MAKSFSAFIPSLNAGDFPPTELKDSLRRLRLRCFNAFHGKRLSPLKSTGVLLFT
jgi:hypothetical protein